MVSLRNFTNKCVLKCGSLVNFFSLFFKSNFHDYTLLLLHEIPFMSANSEPWYML